MFDRRFSPNRFWVLCIIASAAVGLAIGTNINLAWVVDAPFASVAIFVASVSLFSILFFNLFSSVGTASSADVDFAAVCEAIEGPTFITTASGQVIHMNVDARQNWDAADVTALLGTIEPSNFAKLAGSAENRSSFTWNDVEYSVSSIQLDKDHNLWRARRIKSFVETSFPVLSYSKTGAFEGGNKAANDLFPGNRAVFEAGFGNDLTVHIAKGQTAETMQVVRRRTDAGGAEVVLLPSDCRISRISNLEHFPVPLMSINSDLKVAEFNAKAAQLFATGLANGISVGDVIDGPGRRVTDWLGDAFSGRGIFKTEVVCMRGDDDKKTYLQVTLSRVSTDSGLILIAAFGDATPLKNLETQMAQSQKMQAIGQLAGGVAHDFNNLLTAIRGHCDLMLMRHLDDSLDRTDLLQISDNTNRAVHLVKQLLGFSRKQALNPQIIEVSDVLSDISHLLSRLVGEKVDLNVTQDPDLGHIRIDKLQLEQVIMNLVVNARDAMPQGGNITINGAQEFLQQEQRIGGVAIPAGKYLSISVTDTGTGIPADRLERIFEPFFTTKAAGEGTGLGLSMAYGIVKQSGGYIIAESTVGKGTIFRLFFPLEENAPKPSQETAKRVPSPKPSLRNSVICLVEDEAPVRAFATRALNMRGFSVIEAENGEQALNMLSDGTLNVDLVISDVIMPNMDGPSWVRIAREKRPKLPVIFMSGYSEDYLERAQDDLSDTGFISKPFSLNDLIESVQNKLAEAQKVAFEDV